MFGTLGGPELLLILVIALIVFGPRKLPEIGKSMGRMLAEFRKASNDFKRTIEDEIEAEKVRPEPPPAVSTVQELPVVATGTPEAPAPLGEAGKGETETDTREEATVAREGGGPPRD